MSQQHMNFVFFFPDEMRAESIGCYGHPLVKTPHMDNLAAEGVRFDQCHVQNTVCSPSRCSLMTGLYPHVSGHRTLWHLLRPHEPSLFRYLKQAGYQIKWFGKNHTYCNEYLEEILGEEAYQTREELERSMRGEFRYENPFDPDDERFYSFLLKPHSEGGQKPTETELSVEKAIRFLQSDEAREKPFVLFLPTLQPHAPYVVPEPYYSMYDPEALAPLKPSGLPDKPSYHELIRSYRRLDRITDDTLRKIQAIYLGMISYVDDQFGRLMEALSSHGWEDNTTVIVSSDHGDYAGDYGLVEKWPNAMEDCLTRVPLIVRAPGNRQGHVVREQVELFDIMPTMLELAGTRAEHDHFAVSLVPQLFGAAGDPERAVFADGGYNKREPHCFEGDPVRDAWFANNPDSFYWPKARQQQEHPDSVCRATMLRTMQYKLVKRTDDASELYDLQSDPGELHNVYDDASYADIRRQLEQRMLEWYIETSDIVPRDSNMGMFILK
ncbi:Arylsulfatase [Paenibacillus konkukensis]|uniref:Arylsulfatase n=2 Tax=Paenibacillus konkukensis TaxID=2020716 RepID=A0ABY4RH51_9BACL|nr:Arylsulfatase [Paenibacillus konkukensis]